MSARTAAEFRPHRMSDQQTGRVRPYLYGADRLNGAACKASFAGVGGAVKNG